MTIPLEARLPDEDARRLRTTISSRLASGKDYWRPLSVRQDGWALMYFLQDVTQQMKPVGYRRFISNEPRTALDLAASILTRNDVFWRIALNEMNGENMDERRNIGRVERTVQGMVYDIDEMFSMRGLPRFWKQVAQQGLLRGWIWGKVHVTTEALLYRESPLLAEVYDSRLVYPHFDSFGLNYVMIQRMTTMGDLVNMFPDKFGDREQLKEYDPNKPVTKIEYWSNDRGSRRGINAVLAVESTVDMSTAYDLTVAVNAGAAEYIIEPYYHGYTARELPVVGVPANGISVVTKPQLGDLLNTRLTERYQLLGSPNPGSWWQGNNVHVAESGRSILSSEEEHVPQYNELIATIFQHLSIGTYGTWVFTTPTGELPAFEPGIESRIALTPEEKVQRLEMNPITPDAYKLVQLLSDEKQNGTLSNVLRATDTAGGSGVLFQQRANAALNALEPYQDAMEEFGQRIGTSLIEQIKRAAPLLKPWDVVSGGRGGRNKSLFVIQFDPVKHLDSERNYRVRPVFKPSLPDDLAIRINAARLALDPRRPILSLVTVLENILQVDDPSEEIDRIWEDIANCVTPGTLLLTRDMRWVKAEDLKVGDALFAFEDNPTRRGSHAVRHYEDAIVERTGIRISPVYKITLEDGRSVRATGEHKWIIHTGNRVSSNYSWMSTEEMCRRNKDGWLNSIGRKLRATKLWMPQFFGRWDGLEDDIAFVRDTRYLAGAFDADGCVSQTNGNGWPAITFAQYDNACLAEVESSLTRLGFRYVKSLEHPYTKGDFYHIKLKGGRNETLRFLGQVRPPRLLANFAKMNFSNCEMRSAGDIRIVSVEEDGNAPVVSLTSSSGTYFTEYGASHNTDPVIVLEQVSQALERMGEPDIAKRIRENEFQTQFLKELQFRQQAGLPIPQIGQQPGGPGGAGSGTGMANPAETSPGMTSDAGANPFSTIPTAGGAGNLMPGVVSEPASDLRGEVSSTGARYNV